MASAEGVVFALLPVGEAGKAPVLPNGRHPLLSASEELVDINLVAHIPDDLVLRSIEKPMERDRELNHPKVRGEVSTAADTVHSFDEKVANLTGELLKLFVRKAAKVERAVHSVEKFGQPANSSDTK
jgi:hypothetical protein